MQKCFNSNIKGHNRRSNTDIIDETFVRTRSSSSSVNYSELITMTCQAKRLLHKNQIFSFGSRNTAIITEFGEKMEIMANGIEMSTFIERK